MVAALDELAEAECVPRSELVRRALGLLLDPVTFAATVALRMVTPEDDRPDPADAQELAIAVTRDRRCPDDDQTARQPA